MSRKGPQPGRQRPRDGGLFRLRTGAGGSGSADPAGSGKGALTRPQSLDRQVTPSLLIGATSSPLLPPAPPKIPQHRSPPPAARDPNPDPTATAPSPGRGVGHQAGGQPEWQQRLRAARSQGRAAAGPRPVRRASGHRAANGAGGRGRAWPESGDRGGPECAPATGRGRRARRPRRGPGAPRRDTEPRAGLDSRPRGAGTGLPGRAAALDGRGSDAAAFPFSCPGPCSPATSSSLGPRRRRRRLSLGASRASPLHQGRADPQGPSRKVRGCCRFPQLLVAIFNPPPPPPPAFSTSRWLPD
ncbi:translation initiation factor IF-2-like [Lutra lutra]|uniref:translation initiation factor IF-2-like n=1 Tax=Lutra lutra TaxID=9657 RepID=UPI001FD19FCA|nr:translation initiation factor IF-2-like [Lutra lutra]